MVYNFEVAIVGGGPAGSSAAINLAKKGFDVCLFEKKVFPRETVCGEFLSKEVIENLRELNLFEKFQSLNPNKINSFRFINNNGDDIFSSLDFQAYSLKRSTFDNFLLQQAKENNVKIFQPAEVIEIINLEDHYKVVFYSSNKKESVEVKNVIAAYGKQNILDKCLHRSFINVRSKLNGIKFHLEEKYFDGFNKNEIHIYSGKNIYCGINAVNDNMVTLCFLEDRNYYSNTAKDHLMDLFDNNIRFKNLFNTDLDTMINHSTIYGTGNIYFGKKNIIENGIYMIGDAAGIIAPLAGDGIGIAFESAKVLVDLLFEEKEKKIDSDILGRKYINEWNNLFSKRLFTAKLIQDFILKNYLKNIGFYFIKMVPNSLNYFIKATRT